MSKNENVQDENVQNENVQNKNIQNKNVQNKNVQNEKESIDSKKFCLVDYQERNKNVIYDFDYGNINMYNGDSPW